MVAPGSDAAMSAQPPYPHAAPPPGYVPANSPQQTGTPALARRAVLPLTLLHVALSILIFVAPIALLAAGDRDPSPASVWAHFRDGGWGMWLITLVQMFLVGISAALGAMMIRGMRIPGAALFTLALGPFAAAMLGTLASFRIIMGAISGASVDPSQKARILAQGLSELSNLYVYGGLGAAFAMYLAGLAAAFTLITIDPAALGPTSPSKLWMAGPAVGTIAAIAAIGARIALRQSLGGLDGLVIFGLLNIGALSALSSRPLAALLAARNDEESGRAWRLLLVAAFAFAAAMLLVDRAEIAAILRRPLEAISGESVDPSQRATILGALNSELHGRSIVMIIDALGCFAAFAAPLLAGLAATKKFSISIAVAGVAALLIVSAAWLTGSRIEGAISSRRDALVVLEKSIALRGITLPVKRDIGRAFPFAGAPGLDVQRDGTVADDRVTDGKSEEEEDSDGNPTITVASDGALPFELFTQKLIPALPTASSALTLGLLVAPARRYDYSALGAYAGLLGSDLEMIEVRFDDTIADGLPTGSTRGSSSGYSVHPREPRDLALGVLVDADKARLYVLSAKAPGAGALLVETLPIDDTEAGDAARKTILATVARAHPGLGTLVIAPGPTETMGHITNLIASILAGLDGARLDLVLTSDRAGLEALPTAAKRAAIKPSR